MTRSSRCLAECSVDVLLRLVPFHACLQWLLMHAYAVGPHPAASTACCPQRSCGAHLQPIASGCCHGCQQTAHLSLLLKASSHPLARSSPTGSPRSASAISTCEQNLKGAISAGQIQGVKLLFMRLAISTCEQCF